MVDVANVGHFWKRQSVEMIRNVWRRKDRDAHTPIGNALNDITYHNEGLRRRASKSGARAKGGDVGTMHALGTHVDMDGVGILPYAANGYAPERLLRHKVVSLSRIGRHCFP
jgi:hypothetical protein